MKPISTLAFLIFLSLSVHSQNWKIYTGYSLGLPGQEMKQNIQPVHSLELGILYRLPSVKQLSIGAEFGIGTYANKRIEQTFQFDNNVASLVPVNYNSNTFNAALQTRLDLVPGDKMVIPYLNAKGGYYNFFSTVYVDDPDDPNGCHALDRDNIMSDKTLYWSAGGGFQIDLALFAKRKRPHKVMIDIASNVIHGGTVDYINTKHLLDAQDINSPNSKPMNVQFVNASTQSIHEHTVAQVYSSPLRMIEFRLGLLFNL